MSYFSIIVPVYNSVHYLDRCIDSVLAQTVPDWELILVDDGSKDGSAELCRKYASADQRISYFYKENGGVSSARNKGLDLAKGDFILFIDSDDYIESNTLARTLGKMSEGNYDCVVWGFNQNGHIWAPEVEEDYPDISDFNMDFIRHLNTELLCSPVNKLFKRQLITGRFDESISHAEDFIFCLDYLKNCNSIAFIKDTLYFYDVYVSSSSTHHFKESNLNALEKMQQAVLDYIGQKDDYKLYAKYVRDLTFQFRLLLKDNAMPYAAKRSAIKKWLPRSFFRNLNVFKYNMDWQNKVIMILIQKSLFPLAHILMNR